MVGELVTSSFYNQSQGDSKESQVHAPGIIFIMVGGLVSSPFYNQSLEYVTSIEGFHWILKISIK